MPTEPTIGIMHRYDTNTVICKCGAKKSHPREKVREDWIDRHFKKQHGGQGVRL